MFPKIPWWLNIRFILNSECFSVCSVSLCSFHLLYIIRIWFSSQVRFIRLHFQAEGKLAGVEMEVFMLEKARVTFQAPNDRSFNIFYEMMSEKIKEIARKKDVKSLWGIEISKKAIYVNFKDYVVNFSLQVALVLCEMLKMLM